MNLLDPDRRVWVSTPANPEREFATTCLTIRKRYALADARAAAWKMDDPVQEYRTILDAVMEVISDWRRVATRDEPAVFSREAVADAVRDTQDLYELAIAIEGLRLSDEDRKKSVSPSASNAGGSASTAEANAKSGTPG